MKNKKNNIQSNYLKEFEHILNEVFKPKYRFSKRILKEANKTKKLLLKLTSK